ncbi:MAG: hypothetical protein ACLQIB_43675, partial [Isosphaeraceae bacterium]
MNAKQTRLNLSINGALGIVALALVWLAWSPRDSLFDRVAFGSTWESCSSLVLLVVVAVGIVASHRFFAWRIFWFVVLVAVASGTFHHALFEGIMMWALLAGLAITYRRFLGKLAVYMIGHPSQSLLLIVFFCLLYGLIGTSYGVPNLFWHETCAGRFFSAFGATLLLAVLGVNSFFLDDNYHRNWLNVEDYLRNWKINYGLRAEDLKLGFLFGDPELTVDPNKVIPEPRYGTMISHVLRTARLPMLMLISLPALFPLMFPSVPRFAPRNVPFFLAFLDPEQTGTEPDVGRDLRAWLLGIVCWGFGILVGVFLVKVLIRVGMWLEKRWSGGTSREPRRWRWIFSASFGAVSVLIVAASLIMTTALDLGWWSPDEGSWIHWAQVALALVTLLLAGVWSAWRASELRPGRWPPFSRFLLLSATTYGVIALADTMLRHWWPGSELVVSPGMAICTLLLTLSLFGSWVALLRPVRDGGMEWIKKLKQLQDEAASTGNQARVERLGKSIDDNCEIAHKTFRSDLLALAIVALWIAVVNADDFKLRFEPLLYELGSLAKWKSAVQSYGIWAQDFGRPAPAELQASPELCDDEQTLEAWRDRLWSQTPAGRAAGGAKAPESFRPKLVVVCATGGASRAAYWTARVLCRLGEDIPWSDDKKCPGFHDSVRLITGASGGMVGAAHYLAWRKQTLERAQSGDMPVEDDSWVKSMPTENLSAVASHIAFAGLAQALLPRLPRPLDYDRGQALDAQWPLLGGRFSDYRVDEGKGALPSLVFTPVTVDDGRRLLISNLALERLVVNRGAEVDADGYGTGIYSVAAPEFYRVFGKNANGLTLAMAARMSGTFPMISPAVNLPTDPPVRVVDAAYYDSYGVNIAAAWLFRNSDWLVKNTSGIAIVQIRAFMGRRERL